MTAPPTLKLSIPKNPKRNGRLFHKLADALLEHPETYDQGTWGFTRYLDPGSHVTELNEFDADELAPFNKDCKTHACIAGHAAVLAGWEPRMETYYYGHSGVSGVQLDFGNVSKGKVRNAPVWDAAQVALGLTELEAEVLFDTGWRPKFKVWTAMRKLGDGACLADVTVFTDVDPLIAEISVNERLLTNLEYEQYATRCRRWMAKTLRTQHAERQAAGRV